MFCHKCGSPIPVQANFCTKCGEAITQVPIPEMPSQRILLPATGLKRFGIYLADCVGVFIFSIIIGIILAALQVNTDAISEWALGLPIFGLYFLIFEGIWQRTLGKILTGTKVVRRDGTKPSPWQIFGRTLARLIPFDSFSFLFNKTPIGWHDYLSNTLVVPQNYTEEDVRRIDYEARKKNKTSVGIIIIIIFGFFILIGILAGVILGALGAAREKGQDAAIKAQLVNTRVQAELYFEKQKTENGIGTYLGACDDSTLKENFQLITKINNSVPNCNDGTDWYVMTAKLRSDGYYCVDSIPDRQPHQIESDLSKNDTKCPQ